MRSVLLVTWLMLPIGAWAYHEGPGQDRLALDECDALFTTAHAASARGDVARTGIDFQMLGRGDALEQRLSAFQRHQQVTVAMQHQHRCIYVANLCKGVETQGGKRCADATPETGRRGHVGKVGESRFENQRAVVGTMV